MTKEELAKKLAENLLEISTLLKDYLTEGQEEGTGEKWYTTEEILKEVGFKSRQNSPDFAIGYSLIDNGVMSGSISMRTIEFTDTNWAAESGFKTKWEIADKNYPTWFFNKAFKDYIIINRFFK